MSPHNPINNVVIIVKENHTFDNYFGTFPGAAGQQLPTHAKDPPAGGDPPHTHGAWLETVSGAKSAVKEQYQQSDIPHYFALAQQFTLCDNYFTEIASQSEPNHLMLIAAYSPIIDNSSPKRTYQPQAPFSINSLPAALQAAKLTWRCYCDKADNYFDHITALKGSPNIVPWTQFDTDADAGKLPNVCWVYAPGLDSEHPPFGANAGKPTVKLGQQWTADRVGHLAKSSQWPASALFITWDDWGGWYDHVQPLQKDKWANGGPKGGPNYSNTQFSYGPRVGCLVVSPYSKKGISKVFHSHVSIVKFCEITFGIKPLNTRDAASDDMTDCFNFQQAPLGPPVLAAPAKPGKHK